MPDPATTNTTETPEPLKKKIKSFFGIGLQIFICIVIAGIFYKQVRLRYLGEEKPFIVEKIRQPKLSGKDQYEIWVKEISPIALSISKRTREYLPGDTIILLYSEKLNIAIFLGDYPKTLVNVIRMAGFVDWVLILIGVGVLHGICLLAFYSLRATIRSIRERRKADSKVHWALQVINMALMIFDVIVCYLILIILSRILVQGVVSVEDSGFLLVGVVMTGIIAMLRYLPELLLRFVVFYRISNKVEAQILRGVISLVGGILFIPVLNSFLVSMHEKRFNDFLGFLEHLVKYVLGL